MYPSQHGFIPGKGTTTAWQEIITRVIPARFIFEVDFKEFYDRINLDNARVFLQKTGLNPELCHQIIGWSRTPPRQPRDINQAYNKLIKNLAKLNTSMNFKANKKKGKIPNLSQVTDITIRSPRAEKIQATDVTWMSINDQMRDIQNHLNSRRFAPPQGEEIT